MFLRIFLIKINLVADSAVIYTYINIKINGLILLYCRKLERLHVCARVCRKLLRKLNEFSKILRDRHLVFVILKKNNDAI